MPEEQPSANPDSVTPPPPQIPRLATLHTSLLGNTPRRPSLHTHAAFSGGDLTEKREALLDFLGNVPEVSTEFLYESVLSFSISNTRPTLVDAVETSLIEDGILTQDGRWAAYPSDPKDMKGTEDAVFAPLTSVIHAIVAATKKVCNQVKGKGKKRGGKGGKAPELVDSIIEFMQKPSEVPSGERQNLTRPDITGVLTERLESILPQFFPYSWFSIALPGEFKKQTLEEAVLDNVRKIIWSAMHILANDPGRRAVFGFTIEDAKMRVWFMSRSHIMACKKFDFISSPKELIRAISTFSFAEKEDLGFDTTITQFKTQKGDIQYKIQLKGVTYVTVTPLSDYRANALRGRATRVWRVYKEGAPDVHYALKDVWMSTDSATEGEQLRLIREALEGISVPAGAPRPSSYFLTVVDDEYVPLSDGTEDSTLSIMGGKTVPLDAKSVALFKKNKKGATSNTASTSRHTLRASGHEPSQTMRYGSHGLPLVPLPSVAKDVVNYGPRTHYRITFKEAGTTIYDLNSAREVMKALSDAVQGLKYLHLLGLVHRDISPGNIIMSNGVAKITDLEYLKVYNEELAVKGIKKLIYPTGRSKEDKTGTEAFFAVEVVANQYLFIPDFCKNPTTNIDEPLRRTIDDKYTVFHHNPLHDIESTFWIALWMLIFNTPSKTLSQGQQNLQLTIFRPNANRVSILHGPMFTQNHFPAEFLPAVQKLLDLRRTLKQRYTEFEATLDLGDLKLEQTLEIFAQSYAEAADELEDIPFDRTHWESGSNDQTSSDGNSSDGSPDPQHGKKRRREEDNEDALSSDDSDKDGMLPTVGAAPVQRAGPKRVRSGPAPSVQNTSASTSVGRTRLSQGVPRRSTRLSGQERKKDK
ncbi:hypothetical protein C8R43DRAFT_1203559 [Mycena crocata]|nr:hypothetical protein C8R43DRAFT_1203559 [Mycena crocata]